MSMTFTKEDRDFLRTVGISVEPTNDDIVQALAQRIAKHQTPVPDGTVRLLERFGIPVTRENYLMLAFAGHPPTEPLDGEIEASLPDGIRTEENTDDDDATCDAPSAGPCGEPSHTPYNQEESDDDED